MPDEVLGKVLDIEKVMGRKRISPGYHSRTIDIDILFYDDLVINSERLTIPHPRIQERNFVLVPMNEIAGDYIHPVFNKTIEKLQLSCKDKSRLKLFMKRTVNGGAEGNEI